MSYRLIEPFTTRWTLQQDDLVWQYQDFGTIYQIVLKIEHTLNNLKRVLRPICSVMLLIAKH